MIYSIHYQLKALMILSLTLLIYSNVQSQRPNIIYILADDMGYSDLSCYGNKNFKTPNIDKLASQAVKFVNAYSAAPLCTPTRAAFMTGRYPAKTPVGLIEPLTGDNTDTAFGLSPGYPSIATLMKSAGYHTALIGKWHLGSQSRFSPTKNGFDYFFGFRSGALDYISHKNTNSEHDLFENDTPVYPQGYLTELISDKAITYIKQEHHQPFFLTIAFNAPHWPWQGPNDKPYPDSIDFRDGGSPAIYEAMMKSMDEAVEKILRALDDVGLTNKTIVIFTNDNGGERYSDNGGFAKGKGSLKEGGIRIPAFVRWPGKIVPGITTQQLAITMDWTATILSVAGAKANTDFPLDGINLMPVLTGKIKNIDRTFYWRTFQRLKQKAIREGDWKYLQDGAGEHLFNLVTDPAEETDLKEKEKDIFERLKKKYIDWEKTVLKPIPLSN